MDLLRKNLGYFVENKDETAISPPDKILADESLSQILKLETIKSIFTLPTVERYKLQLDLLFNRFVINLKHYKHYHKWSPKTQKIIQRYISSIVDIRNSEFEAEASEYTVAWPEFKLKTWANSVGGGIKRCNVGDFKNSVEVFTTTSKNSMVVGTYRNSLRELFPYFQYTYAMVYCPQGYTVGNKCFTWCQGNKNPVNQMIVEYVDGHTFEDFMEFASEDDFNILMFRVLNALQIEKDLYRINRKNFRLKNIKIVEFKNNLMIKVWDAKTKKLTTFNSHGKYLPVLTDEGCESSFDDSSLQSSVDSLMEDLYSYKLKKHKGTFGLERQLNEILIMMSKITLDDIDVGTNFAFYFFKNRGHNRSSIDQFYIYNDYLSSDFDKKTLTDNTPDTAIDLQRYLQVPYKFKIQEYILFQRIKKYSMENPSVYKEMTQSLELGESLFANAKFDIDAELETEIIKLQNTQYLDNLSTYTSLNIIYYGNFDEYYLRGFRELTSNFFEFNDELKRTSTFTEYYNKCCKLLSRRPSSKLKILDNLLVQKDNELRNDRFYLYAIMTIITEELSSKKTKETTNPLNEKFRRAAHEIMESLDIFR